MFYLKQQIKVDGSIGSLASNFNQTMISLKQWKTKKGMLPAKYSLNSNTSSKENGHSDNSQEFKKSPLNLAKCCQ